MASLKLTEKYVASVTAAKGQRLEVFDVGGNGLVLRVTDQGRKTWVFRYRTPDGRQPRYTIGTYPAKSLADARADAVKLTGRVADGEDPASERRTSRITAKSQDIKTFADLAESYFTACEEGHWTPKGKKKRARTLADDRAVHKRYVKAILGKLRPTEITREAVKKLLRDMKARGIEAQTNRTHAFIRQVFAYAISEFEGRLVNFNPATGFSQIGKVNVGTRILDDDELERFWAGLKAPDGLKVYPGTDKEEDLHLSRPMAIVLQLCVLLLLRENEVVGMMVDDVDLQHALWLIPAGNMKGDLPHLVPLPDQAIELIKEAMSLRRDPKSPFVFPSHRGSSRPMRPDSVSKAATKMMSALQIEDASGHDLRRTGSTIFTSERLGISHFIRSLVLAHNSDTGGGAKVSRQHYDANAYIKEKRQALEAWQRLLLEIVGERPRPHNVTQLSAAR